jgi:hypothetical protein
VGDERQCVVCQGSLRGQRSDARACRNVECRRAARVPTVEACAVSGCVEKPHSKAMCRSHYHAWILRGETTYRKGGVGRLPGRTHCTDGHPITEPGQHYDGRCRRCSHWRGTQAWKVMRWTERDFHRAVAAQNGKCVICAHDFDLLGSRTARSPVFDHCHSTGRGRGIVCHSCNTGLGFFGDNPDRLEAAAAYLRAPLMEALNV